MSERRKSPPGLVSEFGLQEPSSAAPRSAHHQRAELKDPNHCPRDSTISQRAQKQRFFTRLRQALPYAISQRWPTQAATLPWPRGETRSHRSHPATSPLSPVVVSILPPALARRLSPRVS